ncbi:MAG TPA: response regulator [Burkholderiaceae bacterium]|nr:response regulator [Burkholderiaceae bacterium]
MHILYAEDHPADADLLQSYLAAAAPDIVVQVVDSGAACLERLTAARFDAVLLDNHLSDMDGIGVLRELRASGERLPVVLITGAGDDMTLSAALQAGASDYVAKSQDYLHDLPRLLRAVVSRQRSRSLLDTGEARRRHRVLYVEPNAMDAEMTCRHFDVAAAELQLSVVVSGEEALALIDAGSRFDLVLTDLRLPRMGALDLMREVQVRGIEVPFIVITGHGDEVTAVALLRMGAYDYIVKRHNYLQQLPHSILHALHRANLDKTAHALQSELVAMNASLEEKVAQRTCELQAEIRARQQAQEHLQRSEALLRMASRMAHLGAWRVELPGRRMVWSEEAATIHGADPRQVQSIDSAIGFCVEGHGETYRARLDRCMREGVPFDEELQIAATGGPRVWVRVVGQAVRGPSGAISHVQGTIQDVSERKLAESERRALEMQLRESQKLEAMGTFAGGIAHDFNNMLGAILGNASLAMEAVAPLDAPSPAQTALRQIQKTALRGRDLVRQILAFSRRQQPAFVAQSLRPLIKDTLGMLRAMLPAMVELRTALTDEPVWIDADGVQIQQVIVNLCANAWHAMPDSTGRIELSLDIAAYGEGASDPSRPTGCYARLRVSDNGCGMDEATRARIFEPFFTTKPVGQGTGLGLAVVHGIVSAHRGAITVDSTPGVGSTFSLWFPLAPAGIEPPGSDWAVLERRDPAPAPVVAHGQHVLYVDDDEVMMLMVERLLQRCGYRVTAMVDAVEALDFARRDPSIDVVVCDLNMPALSGLALARALGEIRPALPVILSSGYFPAEAHAQASALGIRATLCKENTLEELHPVIQRTLSAASV